MAEPEIEHPKMHRWKLRAETRLTSEEGFPSMGSLHYLTWMEELHAITKPGAYLEIGTESGASLGLASCISIAVDPRFRLQADVSRNKPELHQYQGTSDDFFASDLLGRLGYQIDLAFLDGMHLFEYLLRDFIGMERHMSPQGLLTMHDCVPFNHLVAERKWDRRKTKSWTGDVWKLVPILRRHRPDLNVDVVDTPPTGLVCITGLDPENTTLADRYDEIVAEWMDVTLEEYGLDRLASDMAVVGHAAYTDWLKTSFRHEGAQARATAAVAAGDVPGVSFLSGSKITPTAAPDGRSLRFRVKIGAPRKGPGATWGETYFGNSLCEALQSLGHSTRLDPVEDWFEDRSPDEIDLVLRANTFQARAYRPLEGATALMWLIYDGRPPLSQEEFDHYHYLWIGAAPYAQALAERFRLPPHSVMLQACDPSVMSPVSGADRSRLAYVANNHTKPRNPRRMVALLEGRGVDVTGRGWTGTALADQVVSEGVANEALRSCYGRALAVVNDHVGSMGRDGFVSNRIFDALACGTPVISDPVEGLPEDIAPFVWQVSNAEGFSQAVEDISALHRDAPERLRDLAATMAAEHSFAARAARIVAEAKALAHPETSERSAS